jgi:hypothetical protein
LKDKTASQIIKPNNKQKYKYTNICLIIIGSDIFPLFLKKLTKPIIPITKKNKKSSAQIIIMRISAICFLVIFFMKAPQPLNDVEIIQEVATKIKLKGIKNANL